jgi:hypothetical protein
MVTNDMANKTAMTHLIEKILRMPESNIKGFLKISGESYLEQEAIEILNARRDGYDKAKNDIAQRLRLENKIL